MNTGEEPEAFLGLDVGKTDHWACAVTQRREVVWNKALTNEERKLVDLYIALSEQGNVLVVADQPATIWDLAVAVAQHMNRVSHTRNKRLRRAMFLSAFVASHTDPIGRAYYDKKRAQGKRHSQANIALAVCRPRRSTLLDDVTHCQHPCDSKGTQPSSLVREETTRRDHLRHRTKPG